MPSVRHTQSTFLAFVLAVLAVLVPGIASSLASAAGRFPYTAQVATPQAQFRSGPGESFYATSDANEGDLVEVYHEDGDWSAVRPPRGSHSWVSAKLLKLPATLHFQAGVDLESPVPVEVGVANAPAYIGSAVTGDRDAVAVRLDAGERVYVLSAEPTEGQTWIKIAPPSGEFRWIETKHLKPKAADSVAQQAAIVPPADASADTAPVTDAAHTDDEATLAAAEEPDAEAATNESADAKPSGASTAKPSVKPSAKAATGPSHPARGFWTQLQALEMELSMTVASEPKGWRFDDIRRDAQNLYDGAKSDEEYDAARYLLAKLAQFESVRRERTDLDDRIARRQASQATAAPTPATAAVAAANPARPRTSLAGTPPRATANANATAAPGASPPAAGTQAPAAVDDSRYDAAGRLVAIPTRRAGAPSYAIVDERNNVRQYVSPAPNVNLQPYVGRTVGITGVAGPSPDSTRGHVMAKRIDVLDAPVRR